MQNYHKLTIAIFTLLIGFSATCLAEIKPTTDLAVIQQILETADSETLVIFDIDEVLVQPADQIFQTKNKKYLMQIDQELARRLPRDQLRNLRSKIAFRQDEKLVDDRILEVLAFLKDKNITTIALTNCATGKIGKFEKFEEWRISRLHLLGIDFSSFNNLPDTALPNIKSEYGAVIKSGIVFTGYADKGEVLQEVLSKAALKPKRIIFIDDRIKNIKSVEAVALQNKMQFVGIEYTAVKGSASEEFNKQRAYYQFVVLEKEHVWLSDQQADARLNQS